jgi:hypothetical protein
MGEHERRYLRSVRVKFGLIVVVVLAITCFFVWRDLSTGQYYKVLLLPFLAIAGGLRSVKGYRRPKPD